MMHYELQAVVRPSQQFLKVSGNLTGVEGQEGRFYLNENMEILSACAGGRKIGFWMDREGQRQPVDEVSRPVIFENDGEAFHFQYQGVLPEVMSEVNGIREGLVELAYYSGWYPKPVRMGKLFTYTLDLAVPEDYEVAANGDMEEGHLSEALLPGEKCVRIVSRGTVEDIAIFASNRVSRFHDCLEGLDITFLCPQEFAGSIEKRAGDIAKANRFYVEKYGALPGGSAGTQIVSVFRPGPGWAYKRNHVSFLSADQLREDSGQYRLDFHELAHGWWSVGDMERADWINEAGAEFSAFEAAKAIYGPDFSDPYEKECRQKIAEAGRVESIMASGFGSPYRSLNHYTKTTMMYILAARRFGEERMFDLLRRLYREFKDTKNAVTDDFLRLCDEDMRQFFVTALFAEDWEPLLAEKREIDGYSYQLGVMDAFLEMVAAGVKRLALSHPFACAEEMDNCREAVEELCQGYGAGCYREESLLVTDLFPAKDGKGVCVYLLYKDEKVLEEYLELKKEKERLTALGLYEGEARERLAIRFGGLLSYGEEASRRLIEKNQDRES